MNDMHLTLCNDALGCYAYTDWLRDQGLTQEADYLMEIFQQGESGYSLGSYRPTCTCISCSQLPVRGDGLGYGDINRAGTGQGGGWPYHIDGRGITSGWYGNVYNLSFNYRTGFGFGYGFADGSGYAPSPQGGC